MIKVYGHEFMRSGEKIGFLDDEYIRNHEGDKVGYYQGDNIYSETGRKLAYLEGDYICFLGSSHRIRIEDNNKDVSGGDLNNIQRAAIRALLGE